jgi:hypothetical protein
MFVVYGADPGMELLVMLLVVFLLDQWLELLESWSCRFQPRTLLYV